MKRFVPSFWGPIIPARGLSSIREKVNEVPSCNIAIMSEPEINPGVERGGVRSCETPLSTVYCHRYRLVGPTFGALTAVGENQFLYSSPVNKYQRRWKHWDRSDGCARHRPVRRQDNC